MHGPSSASMHQQVMVISTEQSLHLHKTHRAVVETHRVILVSKPGVLALRHLAQVLAENSRRLHDVGASSPQSP